jgi:hypothetical protein
MKTTTYKVKLVGTKDLIFNKFNGIKDEDTPTIKKFDLDEKNGLYITDNRIYTFLFDVGDSVAGRNTIGAIKLFTGRKHKELIVYANAFIGIAPEIIPLTRNGKQIIFSKFGKDGIEEFEIKTGKGKPQYIKRPMIKTPWEVEFELTIKENDKIEMEDVKGWFVKGGNAVGLGAWRPRYGQFIVEKFEKK